MSHGFAIFVFLLSIPSLGEALWSTFVARDRKS